jgi:hypothetical protein
LSKNVPPLNPAIKEEKNGNAPHFLIDNFAAFSIITRLATSNLILWKEGMIID